MEELAKLNLSMISLVVIFCQILAMIVIVIGVGKAFLIFIKDVFTSKKSRVAIEESRLEIGHSFSLSLAFLIGASILKTTAAPSWTEIGQLLSIIAIRILLNHFLLKGLRKDPLQNPAEQAE
jgi:uncharacterized membrane protein